MGNEIYLILKKDSKSFVDNKGNKFNSAIPVGNVLYNDLDNKLIVDINDNNEIEFDSIVEVIKYVEKNNWILCDMQGDIYDFKTHMSLIENINKIGCGYIFR